MCTARNPVGNTQLLELVTHPDEATPSSYEEAFRKYFGNVVDRSPALEEGGGVESSTKIARQGDLDRRGLSTFGAYFLY